MSIEIRDLDDKSIDNREDDDVYEHDQRDMDDDSWERISVPTVTDTRD